jgi:hypothetical protein
LVPEKACPETFQSSLKYQSASPLQPISFVNLISSPSVIGKKFWRIGENPPLLSYPNIFFRPGGPE